MPLSTSWHFGNSRVASELRLRVEAKLGELIQQEQEAGRLAVSGGKRGYTGDTTLKDIGLTKMDSHRAQKVAEHQDLIGPAEKAHTTIQMQGVRIPFEEYSTQGN